MCDSLRTLLAIASAFDVYLVGRLLGHAPASAFLASQVPAMAETASAAALSERAFERHRFGALLHRYEISNRVLYARAYGARSAGDAKARAIDRALRRATLPLDWLATSWIAPALAD